jgi:hypothetical protein
MDINGSSGMWIPHEKKYKWLPRYADTYTNAYKWLPRYADTMKKQSPIMRIPCKNAHE